ncbi:hypothetical protein [Massilia sp. Leaf139]|uniref:hypothetical protein n=1 Tax=Massilia sp. Leaf139 TaxID=1736272 RepID=UPI000B1C9044|nr:hypothetical protein [Massilia sp. Leaf139]
MNRDHQPCGKCNRFPPAASAKEEAQERTGHCSGWEKPVLSTNVEQPCVLFLERGTWATRQREKAVSRDQFPRDRKAPAQPARPARATTTTGETAR